MKKYLGYIITLAAGLVIGGLIWSGGGQDDHDHDHMHEDGTIYTCSMHPQIRQSEPGKCPLCGMDLTPADADGGADADPVIFEMTANALRLAAVQTTMVRRGQAEGASGLRLNARISVNTDLMKAQVAHLPGRIEKLYVAYEGQVIPKGSPVAEIYSPALIKAQEEWRLSQRMDEATRKAAESKLRQWRLQPEQIQAILQSDEPISTFTLYADESSTVSQKMVNLGDYLSQGAILYQGVNLQSLWLEAEAYEKDLQAIRLGQELSFRLAAMPGQVFTAKVNYIDPFIDPVRRTAIVRASLANTGGKFKPDMLAQVELNFGASTAAPGILIPVESVLWTGKRSVVYVLDTMDADKIRFGLREVELGPRLGSSYVVLGGLDEGEQVVSQGTFSVDAAAQLAGKASMMNRAHMLMPQPKPEIKLEIPDLLDQSSPSFKKQLFDLVNAYVALKDALVETTPAQASRAALALEQQLANTQAEAENAQVKEHWAALAQVLHSATAAISKALAVDAQRDHFMDLSNAMILMVEKFGFDGPTLYLQNCPMANNDLGADWLALEENIRNPYFGDLMMTCGTVEGIFEKRTK